MPQTPVYRADLTATEPLGAPRQVVPGAVTVDREARSLIGRAWRSAATVLIRESGF